MENENSIEKSIKYFSKIINIGFNVSFLNIFVLCFTIFSVVEIFLDPLNNFLWTSLTGIFVTIFIISLIVILFFLSKIIVNNIFFIKTNDKKEKIYFAFAIALFLLNSVISFLMFKKMLFKNGNDRQEF